MLLDQTLFIHQISVNFFLFFISLVAIAFNRNNFLIALIGFEVMLLSANLNFIVFSYQFNDVYGKIFSIFILTIAASESAIGLAILIVAYKILGTIEITNTNLLLKS